MPPRSHPLLGGAASGHPHGEESFSDEAFHQRKREQDGRRGGTVGMGAAAPRRRWSYVMEDVPAMVWRSLHDVNKGYMARVAVVVGFAVGTSYAVYRMFVVPWQEQKPLAKRWYLLCPRVPVTLVEKNREEGSDMVVYRFTLPHSYDYAGYEPVSSVRLYSGRVRELSSLSRWYTPISHPKDRGFIEFAIKERDPGRMSSRLRYLERGDVVYLGRWMREFDYKRHRTEELGLICTTSGASIALQLMKVIDRDPRDPTKLTLLYCHDKPSGIPFRTNYFDPLQSRNPGRIAVAYNVLSMGKQGAAGLQPGQNLFTGSLDPETLGKVLPPPLCVSRDGTGALYRPSVLVCGPQSMLTYLCGRVSSVGNTTYWQGPPWRFGGFMRDMGYTRSQVYKFGTSTHFFVFQ